MTTDRIALRELLEKGSDVDLLREMIGFVADRLMALEVEGLCGAGHGERTPARTNPRTGFRARPWETRADTVAHSDEAGRLIRRKAGSRSDRKRALDRTKAAR